MQEKNEHNEFYQWYQLVRDAQNNIGARLERSIEHYIILTLQRSTLKKHYISSIIGSEYYSTLVCPSQSISELRDIGDHCLLIAGLFPDFIKKKNVSKQYIISIGKSAYLDVSTNHSSEYDETLFFNLSYNFHTLTKLLNAMRRLKKNSE